ncbi:MAG: aldose 1-epimerase family protein [Beijerinckiaceae bacterium]
MEDRRGEGLNAGLAELVSGDAVVRVSARGAEAVHWSIRGRDLLWDRSTSHWDRVAPILFPCVGWSRGGVIRVNNRIYPMPVHGFAHSSPFVLTGKTRDSATFELNGSDPTFVFYPYAFRLGVQYALTPFALRIELAVTNTGDDILPYACGVHPGFAWPFGAGEQDAYEIRFSEVERPAVPVITEDGLFSPQERVAPLAGRRLPLSPSLFNREALCFLDAKSRAICFAGPEGQLHAEADGFRHWALWSRPGAPFLCLEAWTGHGDPERFDGDFREKPSLESLEPGAVRRHALTLRFADSTTGPGAG